MALNSLRAKEFSVCALLLRGFDQTYKDTCLVGYRSSRIANSRISAPATKPNLMWNFILTKDYWLYLLHVDLHLDMCTDT
jgi:hypothetical protein